MTTFYHNVYDYGFRGYYATIGRFTLMDPLCEKYDHISPYAYAGNNFVNCIDWMGLAGYAFNATTGRYERKIEEDGPNYGVIVDDNGQQLSTFEFADPINDPEAIENGDIDHVLFVNDEQISQLLEESGVYDTQNQENKYSFIYHESNAGDLLKGEGRMDYVINGNYRGAHISLYDNYLFITNVEKKSVAHNTHNFGNFLWGAGASALGIPRFVAKLGAHANNFLNDTESRWHLDSKDDQFSIKLGYKWQKGQK